jgi:hypothetical protein
MEIRHDHAVIHMSKFWPNLFSKRSSCYDANTTVFDILIFLKRRIKFDVSKFHIGNFEDNEITFCNLLLENGV